MAASRTQPTRISILLRLYPPSWRARYAGELAALLADTGMTPLMVLDIAIGALDARWSGDYPSAAGDDRKVRRPMVDRLAAVLTALGGLYFATVMAIILVASPPEGSPAYTGSLLGIPLAMAALTLGIAGRALGTSTGDAIGRALGLVASGLAAGITLAIMYLFFVGDLGMSAVDVLFPAFAIATGLVGARIVNRQPGRLAGLLLIAAGGLATVPWLVAFVVPSDPSASPLTFGLVTLGWGLVGLLRLRPGDRIAATT